MGLVDKIKKMTGTAETYEDNYDDDYYNEFDDAEEDQEDTGTDGIVSGPQQNTTFAGGGISLSGSSVEVKMVKPEGFSSAKRIADHLLNKRTVVLNLENSDKETARRLIDFLGGVAYSIGGSFKKAATTTYIIAPDTVNVGIDKLNADRKAMMQDQDDDSLSDI